MDPLKKVVESNDFALFQESCYGQFIKCLQYACEYKRNHMVLYLLEHHGMSPNTAMIDTYPICIAARTGNIELAQLLYAHGAYLNTPYHITPLMEAVSNNQLYMVKWFIEKNANIYTKNEITGDNALIVACKNENEDMVTLFLEHDASGIHLYNKQRHTALEISMIHNTLHITKKILAHGAVKIHTFSIIVHYVMLKYASEQIIAVIDQLILEKKSPNDIGVDLPLLNCFIMYNCEDLFAYVIKNTSVNINNQSNYDKDTTLHYSCYHNCAWALKILLKHGAMVNLRNAKGDTPLCGACYGGNLEMIQLLLHHGATICITALKNAVSYNNVYIVKLLFQYGSDPLTLIYDKTLWQFAIQDAAISPSNYLLHTLKDAEQAARTTPTLLMKSMLCTQLDKFTWYSILPSDSKHTLIQLLINDKKDRRACYTALHEGENERLEQYRKDQAVSFSYATIRCLGRSYGTRPIRKLITSYLVYPINIRAELVQFMGILN